MNAIGVGSRLPPKRNTRKKFQIPLPPSNRGLEPEKRAEILRFLLLAWPPKEIATYVGVCTQTVRNVETNLLQHGSVIKPRFGKLGRPSRLTLADKEALKTELISHGWMYQDEMVNWLFIERGVVVHRSTISRLLKIEGWCQKTLRPLSIRQSLELRQAYIAKVSRYSAEDFVFLDESLFN